MTSRFSTLALTTAALALAASSADARTGYYQFPDLHDHTLVFSADGDLWIASDTGGAARKLTSHVGIEYFPRFSPDGAQIAFTGEYGGNRDIYVIPAGGGEPRRLTWTPDADEVIGWMPDGKSIIFRTTAGNHTTSGFESHLYTVPVAGGDPELLPLGHAGRLSIDPQSKLWAFNRGSVEFRTWKRYRGGTAPTIWVGDPAKRDFREVSKIAGSAAFPMWSGGRIFFLADQGGTGNLWSFNADGSDVRRETAFDQWDIRWPAVGNDGRIVFSLAGDLHIFDPRTHKETALAIDIPSERALARVRYPHADKWLESFALAPRGDRLALVTRGEIFSVAAKDGVTLPITRGSGARERGATFSADGAQILYVSDATGEQDLRASDAWGRGAPRVVVAAGKTGWRFPPLASPDGKWLAYGDQTQALYVAAIAGGAPRVVERNAFSEISEYAWSPDGRYLAYTSTTAAEMRLIRIYDVASGKVATVSSGTTRDFSPAWDPAGRYLYFLSQRGSNPLMDQLDEENVEMRNTKPYLVLLQRDGKNPFQNANGMPAPGPAPAAPGRDVTKQPVRVDFDGLADRYIAFPVPVGDYANLRATRDVVLWLSAPTIGAAEGPEDGPQGRQLVSFDLNTRKAKPFFEDVTNYQVAGNAIAVQKANDLFVLEAGKPVSPEELGDRKVSFKDVVIELAPADEWRQMFDEAWRLMRDFYWDANMGGVDWRAMRDKYRALLPRVGSKLEAADLIGEVIGELSTSHTYLRRGDPGVELPPTSTGMLGADVVRAGNAYRIARIYRGDPADEIRAPLAEPGVDVRAGQYILAVNHRGFAANQPFLAAFENLGDRDVVLTVNAKPDLAGARDVVVHTLGNEQRLRYVDWVRGNREYVAQKTDGKVGYIHIPDMGIGGLAMFNTWFYPQLDKRAFVIDARWNGGGFVSQRIIARLRRKILGLGRARGGQVGTYPHFAVDGPFVVLTNEYAGSDGDIFPSMIQLDKLAPVIGKRSWGGVIGIRGDKPLVDQSWATQPEFASWDPKNQWSLEGRGVVPDIEVQTLPQDLARGVDAQLDRALVEVRQRMAAQPGISRKMDPAPDRSRKAYQQREK